MIGEVVVVFVEHLRGRHTHFYILMQQGDSARHKQRRRNSFSRNVRDENADLSVVEHVIIVQIAAYISCGAHKGVDFSRGAAEGGGRQKSHLNILRDIELRFLRKLLLVELGNIADVPVDLIRHTVERRRHFRQLVLALELDFFKVFISVCHKFGHSAAEQLCPL